MANRISNSSYGNKRGNKMKIWNYVFTTLGMILFFTFIGWHTPLTSIFDFFNIGFTNGTLDYFNFNLSDFMGYLFGGLVDALSSVTGFFTTLVAGGITAGLIYTGKADIAIKASFAAAVFIGFIPTLYFVLTEAINIGLASWAIGILAMIFIPYTIGFAFALIEYIVGGGTD